MTEAEWLACEDPTRMLASLLGRASERKLRLFGVVCARRYPGLFADERDRAVLDAIERHADGLATRKGVLTMARWAVKGDEWDDRPMPPWLRHWWETVTFLLG